MGKKEQNCEEIFYLRKKKSKKKNGEKSLNSLFWQHMLKGRACIHKNSGKSSTTL